MRFGALIPAGNPADTAEIAILCERAQFELIGVGDSPMTYRESFATLGWLSTIAQRARIATIVSNVATRDLSVLASASATLNELTRGRAILGLGTGDSALATAGMPPTPLNAMASAIRHLRELTDPHSENPTLPHISWATQRFPIYLSAEGPKTLRLAGQIADGVFLGSGLDSPTISASLRLLNKSILDSGRNLEDFETWVFARISIADSRQDAIAGIASGLVASANRSIRHSDLNNLPAHLRQSIHDLQNNYNFAYHLSPDAASPNAQILSDSDLAEYLSARYAIAGPPESCAAKVNELRSLGVDRICVTLASHNPQETLVRWATEVLPLLSPAQVS